MARLNRGEVIPARLESKDNGKKIDVSDGMIHHWIGSVLLPGVSLAAIASSGENFVLIMTSTDRPGAVLSSETDIGFTRVVILSSLIISSPT